MRRSINVLALSFNRNGKEKIINLKGLDSVPSMFWVSSGTSLKLIQTTVLFRKYIIADEWRTFFLMFNYL